MLSALIRTKSPMASEKRRGDVICIKLFELADWGGMEIRVHQPTMWVDSELENEMRLEFEKTGIPPVRITPYKQEQTVEFIGESGLTIARKKVVKTRSSKYLDIDSIEDTNTKNLIIGDGVAYSLTDATGLIKDKTEEQIEEEFEFNKNVQREAVERMMNNDKDPSSEIIKILSKIKRELKEDGVSIDIVDGKFMEVEE
tara:strand:+ start:2451 stop:3047 length:597 start_codon:yes stop_codon:yes gene_type:complete